MKYSNNSNNKLDNKSITNLNINSNNTFDKNLTFNNNTKASNVQTVIKSSFLQSKIQFY